MEKSLFFDIALYSYLLAFLAYTLWFLVKFRSLGYGGTCLLILGVAAHTIFIARRWIIAGYPPFSSSFETLVLFSWIIVVQYLVAEIFLPLPFLGSSAALLAFITLAYSTMFPSAVRPLMPALRDSFWLTLHVLLCFISYASFALSFLAALLYLLRSKRKKQRSAQESELELFIYKAIILGFPCLTLGILSGLMWAKKEWGRYWAWDPKEIFSLLTWLIYALYLYVRYSKGWKGMSLAWWAVIGFLAVLISYLGANYFLAGLHSHVTNH
jgi:cytochrome c-type biogenesis protein CcsB